jgi:hypothetical protein
VPLALGTTAIVLFVLLWQLALPKLRQGLSHRRSRHAARPTNDIGYDPGRELRAEQRARALLRSCINEEEWAMYRDLGFLRVWGRLAETARPLPNPNPIPNLDSAAADADLASQTITPSGPPYAYLIYPHKPILAYIPQTGHLLNEYCVAFPDNTRPFGSSRLPDSDDVLAKWMALTADEGRLVEDANMHLPGRQIDPDQARRDLARLACWDAERMGRPAQTFAA